MNKTKIVDTIYNLKYREIYPQVSYSEDRYKMMDCFILFFVKREYRDIKRYEQD
jgi:hypothetical protein